jgi:hypothetical protein
LQHNVIAYLHAPIPDTDADDATDDGEQGTDDEQNHENAEGTDEDADAESTQDGAAAEDEAETAAGTADFTIELPPYSSVRLDVSTGGHLLLDGLLIPVGPGVNVPVAFAFSNGETVVVEIPYGQAAESPEREYIENPGVIGGDH